MQGQSQVYIEAPPEKIYQLVSDVTRMGEWSPECRRCHWEGEPLGPLVGARFRGHNRRGWFRWTVPCRVTDVEPQRVFAFETTPPFPFKHRGPQTRWRYDIEPSGAGTILKESFHVLWVIGLVVLVAFGGRAARKAQLEVNLQSTLLRIKEVAEAS